MSGWDTSAPDGLSTLRLLDRYFSLTHRPGKSRRMAGVVILVFCLLGAALTSPVPLYDVVDELPPQRETSEQVVQYGTLDQLPQQREMVPQVSQTDVLDQVIPPQLIPQVPVLPQLPGNQVQHTHHWNYSSSPQQVPVLPQLPGNQTQATSSSESQSSDENHSSESSPEDTSEDTSSPEDTSEDTTSEDSQSQSLSSSNSSSNSDSRSSMLQDRTGVNLDGDTQDDSHGSEENQRRNWLAAFTHYLRRSRLTVMGEASGVAAAGGVRCLTAGEVAGAGGIGCELTGGLGGGTEAVTGGVGGELTGGLVGGTEAVTGGVGGELGVGVEGAIGGVGARVTGELGGATAGGVVEGGVVEGETLIPLTACRGDTGCHSNELTFDLGDDAPGNQYSNQHGDDMIMLPDQEEMRGERELRLG